MTYRAIRWPIFTVGVVTTGIKLADYRGTSLPVSQTGQETNCSPYPKSSTSYLFVSISDTKEEGRSLSTTR